MSVQKFHFEKYSSCDSIEGVSNDVFIAVENISKVNNFWTMETIQTQTLQNSSPVTA